MLGAMRTDAHFTINGDEPSFIGRRCTALWLEQFYDDGQISDQALVTHLCFEQAWYRLYFEPGNIFWRPSEQPEVPENQGLDHGTLLNNLSAMITVVGHALESVAYGGTASGKVTVKLVF